MSDFDDNDNDNEDFATHDNEHEGNEDKATDLEGDLYSINARQKIRDQLQQDMLAFLQHGGEVKQIPDNVRSDPPRKPSADYGSSPI
jgi:hypothetical protein